METVLCHLCGNLFCNWLTCLWAFQHNKNTKIESILVNQYGFLLLYGTSQEYRVNWKSMPHLKGSANALSQLLRNPSEMLSLASTFAVQDIAHWISRGTKKKLKNENKNSWKLVINWIITLPYYTNITVTMSIAELAEANVSQEKLRNTKNFKIFIEFCMKLSNFLQIFFSSHLKSISALISWKCSGDKYVRSLLEQFWEGSKWWLKIITGLSFSM